MSALAALPVQAAPLTRETAAHITMTNGNNAMLTKSGSTAAPIADTAVGGQPSKHNMAISIENDEAAGFNHVTPMGHNFMFDKDVQAAEYEAQAARDATAPPPLLLQRPSRPPAMRGLHASCTSSSWTPMTRPSQQQRQWELDQHMMDIIDGTDNIDTGDIIYPDFAEAAKLRGAMFKVNATQPIPLETFYCLVASDATIYNSVNPGTITAIKADMPGHLIASVAANLPPTPKGPTTYQGPTILVIQVRNTSTRIKVSVRELYIESDVTAFSIIVLETQNLWVAGFLECSNDGDSPITAKQLRIQAISYMLTNTMFAIII
ncbi:hypothetical protein B0H17DRAFT_1201296 [Mycena rosella]|uniref:Uncharacterized protein n=1 Tax=Mycena rosella TaxID=1033263 RepID=A0AAD7GEI4_MYCRO|nr:hypothetical protein B0H17DRAFT_1201296 [Mycena rosella]